MVFQKKRGQIWIETVTYTLIAFVMIGLVLGFAQPKIEEMQDKTIIEQSIGILKQIDSVIREVSEEGIGNKREIDVGIKKGKIVVDSKNDSVYFEITGRYMYSQPGQSFEEGNLNITTIEKGETYTTTIKRNYANIYNITYEGEEKDKSLARASNAYKVYISNKGGTTKNINFEID